MALRFRGFFICVLLAACSCFAQQQRTPSELLNQLSQHYGNRFAGSYLQSLAILARMQSEGDAIAKAVLGESLNQPPTIRSGSHIAGQLAFCRWAHSNTDALARVVQVASLGIDAGGNAKDAMPYHNEMSDAVFMSCPLLCHAGSLTAKPVFFEAAWNHLETVRGYCLREDGLYRHSPLCEAAWGRGNGFPALGLAMCLEQIPASSKYFEPMRNYLKHHLTALLPYQDPDGMWHQVIDHPESYPEFTCTCMISVAIAKAIEMEIVDEAQWTPVIRRSWTAIEKRVGRRGRDLAGCCTGTGKQKNLEAYFRRKEIHGFDERGGAMAMLLAYEMSKLAEL